MLAVLALALLSLFLVDYQGQRHQQRLLQARANARSGLALLWRQGLPTAHEWSFGPAGRCTVAHDGTTLILEGQFEGARVQVVCPQADPGRAVERIP